MNTTLTFAPSDLEPLGPMLAMRPALAMGDSDATYASAEDCADAPTASATHDMRTERCMLVDLLKWKNKRTK